MTKDDGILGRNLISRLFKQAKDPIPNRIAKALNMFQPIVPKPYAIAPFKKTRFLGKAGGAGKFLEPGMVLGQKRFLAMKNGGIR